MDEVAFQSVSAVDRRGALAAAQESSGRRALLLEKDVWVVEILRVLFSGPFGGALTFTGKHRFF